MTREEILDTFRMLANSQRLYGRILRNLTDEMLDYLESKHFTDAVELIMFIEC